MNGRDRVVRELHTAFYNPGRAGAPDWPKLRGERLKHALRAAYDAGHTSAARPPAPRPVVELWDAINNYAIACGGDPSGSVYGNTVRQMAVAAVEQAVTARPPTDPDVVAALEAAEMLADWSFAWAPDIERVRAVREQVRAALAKVRP